MFSSSVRASGTSPDCTGVASSTNTYFQNFESVQYSPEGLLILHFRTTSSSTQRTINADWLTKNDECAQGNVTSGSSDRDIVIPKGFSDFSIRFSSPTHYNIWNNASSTPLTCPGISSGQQGCSVDIPNYPDYYTFGWKALQQNPTGGPLSTLQTTFHHIVLPPTIAPVLTDILPTPEGCTPYSYTSGAGPIFSDYERAEYQNGLLRVHYRMASPFNSGGGWKARLRSHAADCVPSINTFPGSNNASTTPYTRYFSLRFSTAMHWEIWNDELERKEVCTLCQGDIAPDVPYVSFMGSNTSSSNFFRGTPYPPVEPKAGNSNVLFLPGLEASRLYTNGLFGEKKIWEPNRHQDVQDLYLDANGHSLDSSIYVGDILDEAPEGLIGAGNIYMSFIEMMDELVTEETINAWRAYPYDWRADYNDTIVGGVNIGNGQTAKLVDTLESLASSSQTRKVTIVAHSHGGLVAKALVSKLESLGKANLLDQLILVAVPQSGTPVAVEGLLHGESQPFFKRLLLPRWLTRGLAEHMQSAYNLMPMPSYFARVTSPVIEFATSTPLTARWRELYGNHIDNPTELRDFMLGTGDGRAEPAERDTYTPNVLLANLFDKAEQNAITQDAWTPPANLRVTQIVGWGIETLRGIEYTEREDGDKVDCNANNSVCLPRYVLDQRPLVTTDGDKTVVSYSADRLATTTFYVNLYQYNRPRFNINREHSDILEVEDVLNLIQKNISKSSQADGKFLSVSKPIDPIESNRLSIHSPASIDIYDSEGRHTGLIPNPDPNSDIQLVEEQIPNSRYYEFGEGKYVSLPSEGTYRVVIKGTGEGTFTLELENGIAGNYSGRPIFSDIPVSPSTVATLNLDDNILQLSLDQDGDGTFELVLDEGESVTPEPEEEVVEEDEPEPTPEPTPAPVPPNTPITAPSSLSGNGPIVGAFAPSGGQVLGASIGPSVTMSKQEQIVVLRAKIIELLKQVIVLLQAEINRINLK